MASSIKFFFKRLYLYSSTALHGKHVCSKKSPQKDRRNSRKSAPTHPFVSGRIACRRIKGRLRIVTMHLAEDEHHLTWKLQKLPHLSLKADDRGARCPGQGDQERLVALT